MRAWRWLPFVACVFAVSPVRAADDDVVDPASQDASDLARAKELYERASRALDADRLDEALGLFRESKRLLPSQYNSQGEAYCLYMLGRNVEAMNAYEALSVTHASELDAETRRALTDRIAELKGKIATLSVTSRAGGTLKIDGHSVGKLPLDSPVYLAPGAHTVSVMRRGYREFRRQLALGAGQSLLVDATLVAEQPARPPARASAPSSTTGHRSKEERSIASEREQTVGWIVGGVGVVALGVGGYFGLRAFDKRRESDDALEDGKCFRACHDAWEDGRSAATVANIAAGIGVAAIGVSLYLVLTAGYRTPGTSRFLDATTLRW